ncbi:unnamed protein product [Nesidiocoris tenuis]|uniref:Uncharacterized protein n=1 Tax=Nesidiocoris tenuis TaxID=355587 RepID=A0A6H5G3B7_9HEMI|nr:unnamed protein product [Nesidiocoris tenuis]
MGSPRDLSCRNHGEAVRVQYYLRDRDVRGLSPVRLHLSLMTILRQLYSSALTRTSLHNCNSEIQTQTEPDTQTQRPPEMDHKGFGIQCISTQLFSEPSACFRHLVFQHFTADKPDRDGISPRGTGAFSISKPVSHVRPLPSTSHRPSGQTGTLVIDAQMLLSPEELGGSRCKVPEPDEARQTLLTLTVGSHWAIFDLAFILAFSEKINVLLRTFGNANYRSLLTESRYTIECYVKSHDVFIRRILHLPGTYLNMEVKIVDLFVKLLLKIVYLNRTNSIIFQGFQFSSILPTENKSKHYWRTQK